MYTSNTQQCPTYSLEIFDIHLRFGTTFPTEEYPIIIEVVDTLATPLLEATLPNTNLPTDVPIMTIDHTSLNPPFPHRLNKEKYIS